MRKRVLRIVLFAVLSAISALAVIAGCSDKARSITLANFEDQTIEVDYGAVVQTDNSAVYDTDGNVYGVTATVTDADGKNVALVNGAFIADDMRGYKIVYTLVDTSVSAKSKTVTVIVKNDGTPAVYFTDTITAVWTGEEYPVPAYKYTVGSQYAITGNTLELFKVQGENRTKVESFDAAAEKFAVTEAGDYVFVATVTAGEKSTKVELAFEAKNEAQRYAIASCESPANINIADDYYESGAHADKEKPVIAYSADVKRNAYVSHGSVSVSVKSGYGDLGIWATPEISANDFTQRLSEPDTMISAWIYVSGEAESYNVFSVIDSDMPKSAAKSIAANTWTNILLNPDRTDLLKLYNDLCTGKTLFTVQSGESGDVTVYVDSIYVSEPVAKSSTFASVAANTNEEFTVRAESTSGGKFYYTVEGAEENETGTFTSSVVGAILATAYPVQNRYYGALTTVVTLSGGEYSFSFAQAEQTLNAGTHDLLAVDTNYADSEQITYALLKADGSTCYSKISENGTKMRLFEGEHLLTASMTVNDIRYRAITKLSVSPAPVYDAATIEDFDNSYSQDNLEQTQHWNHIPLTYVGDYDGHTGVIKLDLTNMGNTPGFKTVHAIGSANWSATYDEDDFIAFDMKVEGTIPDGAALCNNENGFYYQDGVLVSGWHTYYLSLKNLKFLDTGNVFVFFGGAPEGGNFGITVYIDRIYAVNWESRIRQVTLVDFDDETKQADLYDTISVTHADVKDTEGNTYKVKATVTGPDGETVAVSGDSFVAQKAGTYTVVYTVDDKMIAAKSKTVTVMVTDPHEGWEYTFAFGQEEYSFGSGTHDSITVDTNYTGGERITYTLSKADGSTCYSKISENGTKMRLFEGEHLLTASMTVNDIRYRAITKLSVSPAPVYDAATIEDFDNSYSLGNIGQTVSWNHIPLTYVGDYDGHTGVMKFDLTNLGDNPGFTIQQAIGSANWSAAFDGSDYVAFDLKVEGTIPSGAAICWIFNGTKWVEFANTSEWQTLYIPLNSFDFLTSQKVNVFFGGAPEGGKFGITVYIDRIYAANWESRIKQVELVDFDDETKQADLYDTITVTHADVKDTEGNTYKVKATVTGPDGENITVSGNGFVAQKVGTYTVVYTVDDKLISAKTKTVTITVKDPQEGWEYTFAFAQETYTLASGTHNKITVTTSYTGNETITYMLTKADGSTCYSSISEDGAKMRLFEGAHLLTAAMTVDGVKYSAIATINVSPAPVYDNATIEDFDNSYSLDNIGHTQDWNHIPYTYMGDYDGHSGVIKLDLTNLGNNPGFSIKKPLADTDWSAEYGADDYVAIDMKVEGNIPQGVAIIKNYPNCYVELESGWHTYYLSMDKMGFLSGENIALFFGGVDGENKFGITVYIDRIYASPARPAIEANTIEDFNHPVSMGNLAVHEMPVEYLPEYEGKTGILKLDLTEENAEYPKFQLGAPIGTVNKNNFTEGYIAIDMYVEGTIPEGAIIGNVYNGSLYFQDGSLVNGWHTYYLSLEKLQWLNYNVVEACFAKNPSGAFGITVYIDRIYAVTQAEKDAATNG